MNSRATIRKKWIVAALAVAVLLPGMVSAQEARALTLKQAVTLALQNSRDLAIARVQYNIASDQVAVTRGDFRPNLYTGSGAAYTSGYPSVPGGGLPSVFNLTYTQSIFNLPLKGQLKAAEDRAGSQKLAVDNVRDNVIIHTAATYLDLAKVRHSLDLRHADKSSAQRIVDVTHERVTANQELPIEDTRSQLTAAHIGEDIILLEDREESLTQELHNLTGIPDTQAITVETDLPDFSAAESISDASNLALQTDRSVKEAENERTARQHLLAGAKGEYWPTISLIGEYQVLGKFNNYNEFFNPNTPFQRNQVVAGVQVNIPIFSAKTRADIALAKSQLNEAELMLGAKRQQVSAAVRQQAHTLREMDASHEVARLALKLSQENLQLVQAKFDQGGATLRDLEQAHLDENDKWVAFLDAEFARQQAQLSLLQATGQLATVLP